MTDLALVVDGVSYGGWKEIGVSGGLQQIAGEFRLLVTERWQGLATPRPLRPGQQAQVTIDGQAVITGYIDDVQPEYDARNHTVFVSGRDATGDLVDCAAIAKGGVYNGRTLAQIATDLCAPFGIKVKVQTDVGPAFPTLRVEPGEKVMELLDRAARYRGVLLMSDGLGNLLITQPGTTMAPASIELGKNARSARAQSSMEHRFSRYVVKAQQQGTDEIFGAAASGPSASVDDAGVPRYRPTVIMAEDQANAAACRTRAQWERTVNAARARSAVYTVQGWKVGNVLWRHNTLVPVKDAYLGIDDTMLIVKVQYYLDAQSGQATDITVMGRNAFNPIKLPQPQPSEGLFE